MGEVLSALTGLSTGILSGSALCALYIALGVITKSAMSIGVYKIHRSVYISNSIGAILAVIVYIVGLKLQLGIISIIVFGFFAGMFLGIVIGCIADIVSSIAVIKNLGIKRKGIVYIIAAFGVGKLIGSLVYWLSDKF